MHSRNWVAILESGGSSENLLILDWCTEIVGVRWCSVLLISLAIYIYIFANFMGGNLRLKSLWDKTKFPNSQRWQGMKSQIGLWANTTSKFVYEIKIWVIVAVMILYGVDHKLIKLRFNLSGNPVASRNLWLMTNFVAIADQRTNLKFIPKSRNRSEPLFHWELIDIMNARSHTLQGMSRYQRFESRWISIIDSRIQGIL